MFGHLNLAIMNMTMMLGSTGLTKLWEDAKESWIAPVFFCMVAIGAFMFIKQQAITKLILFLVVAAVVGVLIFGGDALFGKDGALKKMFQGTAEKVGNSNSSGIGN